MMFNPSCTTPTMPFLMEEDQQFKDEIVRPALQDKEVGSAPWMLQELIRCTAAPMEAQLAWTITNIVLIGRDKDFAIITTLNG